MEKDEYWKLFWLSGLPEAWLMSRPGRGDFSTADMTSEAFPPVGDGLPGEAEELPRQWPEQKPRGGIP